MEPFLQHLTSQFLQPAGITVSYITDTEYHTISTIPAFHDRLMFPLGSCGKAMISTLALRLVEHGLLGLDIPIQTFVPEFETTSNYTTAHLTLRDLLNHKWNIKLYPSNLMLYPEGNLYSENDLIQAAKQFHETADLRTTYSYSNYAYALAGIVIERALQIPLSTLLQEHIFNPLKLHTTTTSCNQYKDQWLACYSRLGNSVDFIQPRFLGSSGIFSSLSDLIKWIQFFWSGEKLIPNLLSMQTIRPIAEKGSSWVSGYGFGWAIKNIEQYPIYSHPGDTFCNNLKVIMIPPLKKGLVVLFNTYNRPLLDTLSNTLLEMFVDNKSIDSLTLPFCHSPKSNDLLASGQGDNLTVCTDQSLVGIYSNPVLGSIAINNNLELRFESSPLLTGQLYCHRHTQKRIYCRVHSEQSLETLFSVSKKISRESPIELVLSIPSKLGTSMRFVKF